MNRFPMRFQRGLSAVPVQFSAPLRIIFHLINQTLFSRYFSTAAAATTTSTTTTTAMTTTTTTKNKKRRGKQIYVIFPPPWPRQKNNLVFFLSFSPPPHTHILPLTCSPYKFKQQQKSGRGVGGEERRRNRKLLRRNSCVSPVSNHSVPLLPLKRLVFIFFFWKQEK